MVICQIENIRKQIGLLGCYYGSVAKIGTVFLKKYVCTCKLFCEFMRLIRTLLQGNKLIIEI